MKKVYLGAIINPISPEKCDFHKEGALLVNEEGKIEFCGDYADLSTKKSGKDVEEIDTNGSIIIPAFCDVHIHLPQFDVRGTFTGTKLLPWLKKYIWPEESNFKDVNHARDVSKRFFNDLVKHGTLTASIYGTIHEDAVRVMFEEANIRAIIGKVMMDQNSPEYLTETTEESLQITEDLCKDFAQKGDTYFAVTPRFAPTCTMKVMKKGAEIARRYDTYIQTHLSENKDEIAWVKELFPDNDSYTDVYFKAGLLGPKTIMGHVIHASDKELDLLRETGTKIAHCPTSNEALKSGRMPIEKMFERGIPIALATDVGAGPKTSMLDVMRSFLEVHGDIPQVTEKSALFYATLAGARMLGLEPETGNLKKGKCADFLILDEKAQEGESESDIIGRLCNDADYDTIVQKSIFKGTILEPL